jgi:quercetin dioxygenase-like cupin family protein
MTVVRKREVVPDPIAPGRARYLAHTDGLMVVVIDFEDGPSAAPDPPHSHPHEQVTYVAAGELYFFVDGEPHKLGPGDLITVPSNVPHTIQLLSDRVRLVDTFTPIRADFIKPPAGEK